MARAYSGCCTCGGPLPCGTRGPSAEYCSNACRQRAYRKRLRDRGERPAVAGRHEGRTPAAPGVNRQGNTWPALDSFVGRQQELARLARHVRDYRIVCLVGPPGSGKSRLAAEFSNQVRSDYPDGVWCVDLDQLPDGAEVHDYVTEVLNAGELTHRRLMLVLDNCEHLLDQVGAFIADVVRTCPGVTLVVTSREPVRLRGEVLVPVRPLALPPEEPGAVSPSRLQRVHSVRLFVDRAAAIMPSFHVGADNAEDLATLCARLDGLPLAIEFAARRVKLFTVREMVHKLDHGLDLLTLPSRMAGERHRSAHAAIDWSYRLLGARERVVFHRLSTLGAEFTLAEAEAVCASDGLTADQVADAIAGLEAKSLIDVAGHPSGFRQLGLVLAFGRQAVRGTAGEELDNVPRSRPHVASDPEFTESPLLAKERTASIMVSQGLTNGQIARKLEVSSRTVTCLLAQARRKLQLGSRAELAAWVSRNP